jgi:predicted RNA-binding Zn-ribbon protein involved in translation (DUF1610 family)
MDGIDITVTYSAGHSYREPWEKTEFFCLHCGKKEVWARRDGGDYYQGESYLCSDCGSGWNLPGEPDIDGSAENKQRLACLRTAGQ